MLRSAELVLLRKLFTDENCRFQNLLKSSLFGLVLLLPNALLAQAGSSSPIIFESPQAFFASASNELPSGIATQGVPMRPQGFLRIPEDERYVFWVELESGRLKVLEQLENGGFIVRQIIPVSIGSNGYDKYVEGDKRTPIGVYHFTSFLNDTQLMDYYGLGAYPINYPNAIDDDDDPLPIASTVTTTTTANQDSAGASTTTTN